MARDTSIHEGPLDDIDLTDLDRFAGGFPHPVFARLRRDAPVHRHPPTAHTPDGEAFWVLSRHEHVLAAASAPDVFSSDGSAQRPTGGGTLIEDLAGGFAAGVLLNMMDDPRHQRIRKLVTPALAPRTLALLEDDLRARTAALVDSVAERGGCDFLVDVAAELPLQAIARLLGVPQEDRHQLFRWANASLDYDDRDLGESSEKAARASAEMFAYGTALIDDKRAAPADDLLSRVATATIPRADGDGVAPLEDLEVQMFFNLLIAAGSETTRNSIAGGLLALLDHPDQWRALQADRGLLPTAVEEILRYTSSTTYNRRTATRAVEVGGRAIGAGDKVTLWWSSANHDEAVFPDPHRFDVAREPNRHLAFGHGTHFCLGAALARIEMRVVFDALLERFDRLEPAGPPEWTRSNKHTGLRHLPVAVVPR
ncbi:MAG TPA: cytochrome P450 [Acidimicrobiales bacterium]|nr:cytochrome P450 [Acidimicrobiales bacterium]